jgi:hypothetical protein
VLRSFAHPGAVALIVVEPASRFDDLDARWC